MICKKCTHKDVCDMWIRYMSEVGIYRDITEIPDLNKNTDCPHLTTPKNSLEEDTHKLKWIPIIGFITGIQTMIRNEYVGGKHTILNGLYQGFCITTIIILLIKYIL